jgi:hypothetical protein
MSRTHLAFLMALMPALQACRGCHDGDLVVTDKVDTDPPEGFANDWGSWLSMAAMPDGSPAIAYYDKTRGALGFAIGTLGDGEAAVSWDHEEVDGYTNSEGLDTGDRGKYASMAIADDGTVWIAHHDLLAKNLRYARRGVDGAWTTGIIDSGSGASPNAGWFASLALDATGSPVVAHHDEGKGTLRIAHYNPDTGSFSAEVVDEGTDFDGDTGTEAIEADVGSFARLRIHAGVEYIAYHDAAHGDLKLAIGTAGAYELSTIDAEGTTGQWPDLQVGEDGMWVAYQDVGEQDLKIASFVGTEWFPLVVDDGPWTGADVAVFGRPDAKRILYFDGAKNDLKQATQGPDGWEISTLAGADSAAGFHNEVLETDGGTHIACYDHTHKTVWFSTLD